MSESIMGLIEEKASGGRCRIAIGAENADPKVLKAAESVDFADVIIVGKGFSGVSDVELYESEDVGRDLVRLLVDGEVDAAVRGSCDSAAVMREIRASFQKKFGRVALLSDFRGRDFFLAPVGVDEGNTVEDRVFLLERCMELCMSLGIDFFVGVLAGGRKSDIGRHKIVDKSIQEAEEMMSQMRDKGLKKIKNYHILIEETLTDGVNIIIAPDGVSGNMIFRTLTFLGNGRGYGAPLLGIDRTFVDTSRAGSIKDYISAMTIAKALTNSTTN